MDDEPVADGARLRTSTAAVAMLLLASVVVPAAAGGQLSQPYVTAMTVDWSAEGAFERPETLYFTVDLADDVEDPVADLHLIAELCNPARDRCVGLLDAPVEATGDTFEVEHQLAAHLLPSGDYVLESRVQDEETGTAVLEDERKLTVENRMRVQPERYTYDETRRSLKVAFDAPQFEPASELAVYSCAEPDPWNLGDCALAATNVPTNTLTTIGDVGGPVIIAACRSFWSGQPSWPLPESSGFSQPRACHAIINLTGLREDLDSTPPNVQINQPQGDTDPDADMASGTVVEAGTSIEWVRARVLHGACQHLDAEGGWSEVEGKSSWTWQLPASLQVDTTYCIHVKARDGGGNVGQRAYPFKLVSDGGGGGELPGDDRLPGDGVVGEETLEIDLSTNEHVRIEELPNGLIEVEVPAAALGVQDRVGQAGYSGIVAVTFRVPGSVQVEDLSLEETAYDRVGDLPRSGDLPTDRIARAPFTLEVVDGRDRDVAVEAAFVQVQVAREEVPSHVVGPEGAVDIDPAWMLHHDGEAWEQLPVQRTDRSDGAVVLRNAPQLDSLSPFAMGFRAGPDGDPAEADADTDEGPTGPRETALDVATVVALVGIIVAVIAGLIGRGTRR